MNINAYATLVYQSPYKGFNSGRIGEAGRIQRSQSPYKGFNRDKKEEKREKNFCLNPPIRGSIENPEEGAFYVELSQSPYKGFNSIASKSSISKRTVSIPL